MINPFFDDLIKLTPAFGPPPFLGTGGVWFPLNRTGGQQQDFCNSNFSIAAVTGTPLVSQGLFGPAVSFGSGNYYRTTSAGPYYNKNWTISAWVYTTSLAATQIITCRGSNTQRSMCIYLDVTTGALNCVFTSAVNVFRVVTSVTNVATSKWTHVAGSYDGANLRVYINGVHDNFAAQTNTPQNPVGGVIGIGTYGQVVTTEPFVGSIFDLRFYERALDRAEVNMVYHAWFAPGAFDAYAPAMLSLATSPPPKGGGKKDEPPGKGKKTAAYLDAQHKLRIWRERRFAADVSAAFLPAQYLSPNAKTYAGLYEQRRRLQREKVRVRVARQNALIPASTITILPQQYVPPEPVRTIWRDIVKYKPLI